MQESNAPQILSIGYRDAPDSLGLYAAYLDEHPEVVEEVAAECEGVRAALMCYERAHEDCHRSALLAAVAGVEVVRVE